MAYTEAQKKATTKYLNTLKSISIRVSDDEYSIYKSYVDSKGISLRSFILDAMGEKMKRDSE